MAGLSATASESRFGLPQRIPEGAAGGETERAPVRIDVMVLAINKRHAQVNDGVPGNDANLCRLLNSFPHAFDKSGRKKVFGHFIDELHTGAARQRFYAEADDREPTCT